MMTVCQTFSAIALLPKKRPRAEYFILWAHFAPFLQRKPLESAQLLP
jgi:hypothetical protein